MYAVWRHAMAFLLGVVGLVCTTSAQAAEPNVTKGIPVLLYHEIGVDKEPGETVISFEKFAAQMQYLHDHDYTPITISELVAFMQGAEAPERAVVLTFDDGWTSVLRAVPVLRQYGFKASFWIITGLGIGEPYLEWSDIEALDADSLFEIGSHSVTHPWDLKSNFVTWSEGDVPGRDAGDVLRELTESKQTLEDKLGRQVPYFAWPCGWYTDSLMALAKSAGYEALLTTEDSLNYRGGDIYQIRRTFIDGACDFPAFESAVQTGTYKSCQRSGRVTYGHRPESVKQ